MSVGLRHLVIITSVLFIGCSKKSNPATTVSEAAFCSTVTDYSGGITVSGTASYTRRNPWGTAGVGSGGLGGPLTTSTHPATVHPIRSAEIQVLDGGGNVIQCGTTNASGGFSLALPAGAGAYTISVNSRAFGAELKASVLDAPSSMKYYSLTASVTATTSTSGLAMNATADGATLGGAFNILDQFYEANVYLRAQVASCSTTFSGCLDVNTSSTVKKVIAYWMLGFNPNTYLGGSSTSGLSFYLPSEDSLYILGGIDGDTTTKDTDHFDNSIIIHEYGHFLEDAVGVTDSPGGSHDGNRIIDPRLAWSEGWGNFFQAAVLDSPLYRDTKGNDDGVTLYAFYVALESLSAYDTPAAQGEGNFREFSVTRLLWDAIDTNGDTQNSATDNMSARFSDIWASFTSTTKGFGYAGYEFRSIGLLHLIQQSFGQSNWSQLRTMERHDGNTSQYAQYVTTTCGAASFGGSYHYQLTPAVISGDNGSFSTSDRFYNNDFYHLKVTASGTYTIGLQFADADSSGVKADLDLYIYNASARYGVSADILGRSSNNNGGGSAATETESVAVSLSPGDYLINVMAYTAVPSAVGGQAYYNVQINGSNLCPGTIVP
jgi:hypothetical protein